MDNQKILDAAPEHSVFWCEDMSKYIGTFARRAEGGGSEYKFYFYEKNRWVEVDFGLEGMTLHNLSDIQKILDLQTEVDSIKTCLDSLALWMYIAFYAEKPDSVSFELCDSNLGVLSQIDNMATGFRELQTENDELRARVEELMDFLRRYRYRVEVKAVEPTGRIDELLSKSPTQSLNDLKAGAIEKAIESSFRPAGVNGLGLPVNRLSEKAIRYYANQLRNQTSNEADK